MKYKAFHKLSYGLYLIASQLNNKKVGYIANTAFQVTSSPAQLAISCHKKNASHDIIAQSGIFSVSVLKKELDTKLIGDFGFMSSDDIDKFNNTIYITAESGAPIVMNEAIAWFDCKLVKSVDVGSHTLFIGEVLESDVISDEPALSYEYYREKYKMFSPKNAPTYVDQELIKSEEEQFEEKNEAADSSMQEHICVICGFKYDPAEGDPSAGIPPGTPFEDLPEDYTCPICSASKDYFKEA